MSDELKAAVDYWKRRQNKVERDMTMGQSFYHAAILADAYLAQLDREAKQAAEDALPVTEAHSWLINNGFTKVGQNAFVGIIHGVSVAVIDGTLLCGICKPDVTVRQVRNLISALEGAK